VNDVQNDNFPCELSLSTRKGTQNWGNEGEVNIQTSVLLLLMDIRIYIFIYIYMSVPKGMQ
jgi:hypothetical protein